MPWQGPSPRRCSVVRPRHAAVATPPWANFPGFVVVASNGAGVQRGRWKEGLGREARGAGKTSATSQGWRCPDLVTGGDHPWAAMISMEGFGARKH
jgi:hypothetical protein